MSFSTEQIAQLKALLEPLHSRLDDIDKQQGTLWETSVRKSVESQYGLSFSKEYSILSLQHLAKLLCRSTGWSEGTDPVDVCRTAEKLASRLLSEHTAEHLLRCIWESLSTAADVHEDFGRVGQAVASDPWFDEEGKLSVPALGRCLSLLVEEDARHVKSKLEKLHLLARQSTEGNAELLSREAEIRDLSLCGGMTTTDCVCAGKVAHLLTCRSVGIMLALYQSDALAYPVQTSASFKDLKTSLPFLQLQMDVRGKLTIIGQQVTIEVGEIKRNLRQYRIAKQQLQQRAKLLRWAVGAALDGPHSFVLIGHLFVPRGQAEKGVPDNEIADDGVKWHNVKLILNKRARTAHMDAHTQFSPASHIEYLWLDGHF